MSPPADEARREALARRLFEDPGDGDAHVQAARLWLGEGRAERAMAHLRVAVAADPAAADRWSALATAALAAGRGQDAHLAAQRAIGLDAGSAEGWSVLGSLEDRAGRHDAARAHFARALALDPGWVPAYLGLATLEAAAGDPEASIRAYERALAADPASAAPRFALAVLYHRRLGDLGRAVQAYRDTLAVDPRHASAHHNLAHALLLQGRWEEAWREHAWRPPRLRHEAALAREGRMYDVPAGPPREWARIAIVAEQGLGDTLFFLRFAAALRARGVVLDFVGDARLHAMLLRTGLFAQAVEKAAALEPATRHAILAGDLPLLAPGQVAAPLGLPPDDARRHAARAKLTALGPAPHVAVAWRAGESATGAHETLRKEIPFAVLGESLPASATLVSVQRDPQPGETEALAQALGRPVHDFSAVNHDLEDALALMDAVDDYVGVSSTLVHLRAAAGKGAGVLVPFPPEWRWMATGDSPWFPGIRVRRQGANGEWEAAPQRDQGGATSGSMP